LTFLLGRLKEEISGGAGSKWTPEREEELRELVARAEAAQSPEIGCDDEFFSSSSAAAIPMTQRPNFWRDLVASSRTLRGFSTDALRSKAKRMGILTEGGGGLAGASSSVHNANDTDADGHKGRWNAGQMAELRSLVLARRQHLGPAVVHERGFWLEIRNTR
jgi:hypothetical protein